ncbi:MAG: hypothetical protein ACOC7V_07135 [Spirochaetota bacterium]
MATRRVLIGLLLLALCPASPWSQETAPREPGRLQRGFSSLELGMSMEQTRAALGTDPSFRYRGDPDVSFLPRTEVPVIEVAGRAFIDTAVLQFRDQTLYVISLVLDPSRLDYFAVYESLVEQYGEPDALDPGQAIWESEDTRIALERPLTVKYLDVPTFRGIVESGEMDEALDEVTRDRFLEQL